MFDFIKNFFYKTPRDVEPENDPEEVVGESLFCNTCEAGLMEMFNWKMAGEGESDLPNVKEDFVHLKPMKSGELYECKVCSAKWYVDGDGILAHFINASQLPSLMAWDNSKVDLTAEQRSTLHKIGNTSSDTHGNSSQYEEYPCTVETTDGEKIDIAVVSIQLTAPLRRSQNSRLASDIKSIEPSPYALPLNVRQATCEAEEVAMDFAPTLITLSNGEKRILNWTQHFLMIPGVDASATKVCSDAYNYKNMPEEYRLEDEIIYFVADS